MMTQIYRTTLVTAILLITLVISSAGCQKSSLPELPTATPTYRPRTPEPTATPLFRANRIFGRYGQTLILYVGDTFVLDILEDSLTPVSYDQTILQLVSDPTGKITGPKEFRAIRPGITKITATAVPPCPYAPVGCQPPGIEVLVIVDIRDPHQKNYFPQVLHH